MGYHEQVGGAEAFPRAVALPGGQGERVGVELQEAPLEEEGGRDNVVDICLLMFAYKRVSKRQHHSKQKCYLTIGQGSNLRIPWSLPGKVRLATPYNCMPDPFFNPINRGRVCSLNSLPSTLLNRLPDLTFYGFHVSLSHINLVIIIALIQRTPFCPDPPQRIHSL